MRHEKKNFKIYGASTFEEMEARKWYKKHLKNKDVLKIKTCRKCKTEFQHNETYWLCGPCFNHYKGMNTDAALLYGY